LEEKMAKLAKVEGDLVIKRAGGNEISFYEVDFVLSDNVKDINQARAIIQAGLIDNRLKREVDGYKNWRTCQVTAFEDTDAEAKTTELESALIEATEKGCLPENIGMYADDLSKIKAIQRSITTGDKRTKEYKLARKKEIHLLESGE